MTELIQLLQDKAGISGEQATKSLHAIKEYVTTKFPMLSGAVDNMFASSTDKTEEVKDKVAGAFASVSDSVKETAADVKDDVQETAATVAHEVKETAAEVKAEVTGEEPTMLDKISDVIPGQTGQKIEDFAKNVADKAGDAFDSVKEKLGSFFGGKDDDEKKA